MNNNEVLTFTGEIVITKQTSTSFIESINYLKKQTRLGFDTESKPSFKKNVVNKISLIQFASYKKAILIRVDNSIPREVIEILSDPNIIKIGSGIKNDLQHLKEFANFTPQSFIDIQTIARAKGFKKVNLKYLCKEVLNKHLDKKLQLSNWNAPFLSKEQCIYAATDAFACLLLYDFFLNEGNNFKKE